MRPKDVTSQLGISAATLRLWSKHFGDYLSPGARASLTPQGTAAQRRFMEEDLAVFIRAKSLLDLGLTYEVVAEKLATASSTDLMLLPAPVNQDDGHVNAHVNHDVTESPVAIANGHTESPAMREMISLLQRNVELQEQILAAVQYRPEPTPSLADRLFKRLGV